ncbi:MAG: hypothetical protein JXA23_11355 [Bacteroidales bacterium]|nr:hypothetical protein [Bacteroidales bacterium]
MKHFSRILSAILLLGIIPLTNCSKSEDDPCGEIVTGKWEQFNYVLAWFDPDFRKAEFMCEATATNMCVEELVDVSAYVRLADVEDYIDNVLAEVIIGGSWTPDMDMNFVNEEPHFYWTGARSYNLKQGYSTGPGSLTVQLKFYVEADTEAEAWELFNASFTYAKIEMTYYAYKEP